MIPDLTKLKQGQRALILPLLTIEMLLSDYTYHFNHL